MSGPVDDPQWATNANFSAGLYPGQPNKVRPPDGVIGEGFNGGYGLPAEWLNYWFYNHGAALSWLASFGSGSDGAATLDGTATVSWASKVGSVYTLTRDTALTDLTVTGAGVQLFLANFRLIGSGTLTTLGGARVHNDGVAGSGTNHGTATAAGSLGAGFNGGNGKNGGASNPGSNATTSLGGAGGAGGSPGGAGGTVTAPVENLGSSRVDTLKTSGWLFSYAGAWTALRGGAGGGGGGDTGAGGGGGGSGGGVGVIAFRRISLANATDITSAGGAGAAGDAGGANAGGGGGGGGGYLEIYCLSCNQTLSSATNCAGGVGGAAGGGTGVAGSAGSAGTLQFFRP